MLLPYKCFCKSNVGLFIFNLFLIDKKDKQIHFSAAESHVSWKPALIGYVTAMRRQLSPHRPFSIYPVRGLFFYRSLSACSTSVALQSRSIVVFRHLPL